MKRFLSVALSSIALVSIASCSTPSEPIVDPINSGPVGALNRAKEMLPATITTQDSELAASHDFTSNTVPVDPADPVSAPFSVTDAQCKSDESGKLVLNANVHTLADGAIHSYKVIYTITDPSATNQYVGTINAYLFTAPADRDLPLEATATVSKKNAPLTCTITDYAYSVD
jgi:hypothetical protein